MKKRSQMNWQKKVDEIQERLIMSQLEIAEYCGVVRQCVSNWKTGFRKPGYHARRKLTELIARMDSAHSVTAVPSGKDGTQDNDAETMLKTISSVFMELGISQKKEIFEFVLFKSGMKPRTGKK